MQGTTIKWFKKGYFDYQNLNLNKWVSYFVEGVFLLVAYILSAAEMISYIDGVTYIKLLTFSLAVAAWFLQFGVKTYLLKKYSATKTRREFWEQRFFPEVSYFLFAFAALLMLRALFMEISVGDIGNFSEIVASYDAVFVVGVWIVIMIPFIVIVPLIINYLVSRTSIQEKYKGWFVILFLLLFYFAYGLTKSFIDPALDYWGSKIFDHPWTKTVTHFLLGSPILYYLNALIRGSRLAEKTKTSF
jgi:hypothetical protein